MLEGVVLDGTGKMAQLDGYTSAGKTGTAQKDRSGDGPLFRTQLIASFVGFAPINNPAVTILVQLDSPVGPHEGGQVAAPVFKRVAEQVLAYLERAARHSRYRRRRCAPAATRRQRDLADDSGLRSDAADLECRSQGAASAAIDDLRPRHRPWRRRLPRRPPWNSPRATAFRCRIWTGKTVREVTRNVHAAGRESRAGRERNCQRAESPAGRDDSPRRLGNRAVWPRRERTARGELRTAGTDEVERRRR